MTNYRRVSIPGGTYFFTVALANRTASTLVDHVDVLRHAFLATRAERPFVTDAFVVLPDHLHAVWTLPEGDADFSTRWRLIKSRFVREIGAAASRSASKHVKGERGIWQRRFWEHRIRDETDLAMHVQYCWANPVKHGLVTRAVDWPYSSIHRDIRAGRVAPEWAGVALAGEFGEWDG
ncbi:REP-associated tyrosine transposase [Sinisalibacter lacisalsi]|uniref:Transposase n=1 Tax=Sinisalibacter lacisalsi TaxID=1526570 RepID=A0ABQ1QUT3_9RHOB|nr:transposase [Sinisalibacter lacisalsi]GGD47426.1 transposase [Sinisalibacter lacisalsi]